MAVESSTTVFKADITNFRQAMQEAARAVRLANSEFKEATAGMDKWASSTDGLNAKCKQLNTVLDAQKRQLDVLQTEYNKVAKEEGDTSKGAQELEIKINNQKAAIKNTESELDKYEKELNEAGKENNELANDVEKTNSAMEKANEGFTVAKAVLANLVAEGIRMAVQGLKDLATEAFNVGASFESAMSKVQAVSGASAEEMVQLTDKAKEMGEKTIFSATQSAEAFNYMAMAGWKTEDMLNGIEGIMNLAAASGEDLATTSDIVTDALTAFGLEAKDSGRFADVLAAASSNANTNVSMMGETFKYAAPIAGALGYSIEDTAVAIGLMANAGIKSSQAGTALRKILTELNGEVKVSGQNFGELSIQTSNADGSMRPLADILTDLRSAFDKMTDSEKAANAESIAGKTAMSGLLAMVNASEKDFNKLTTAIDGSTGAAEKMAKTMTDNVSGQLTLLQSNIEGKMIKVFEKAAPTIKKAINNIGDSINSLDWDGISNGVGEFAKAIGDVFSFILKNGGTIVNVIKTIGTVMLTAFAVNTLGSFVGTLNAMVSAYGSLGAVLKLVTSSQLALNAAQLASPLGVILGVLGLVTAGYLANKAAIEDMARADYGLTDAEKELCDTIHTTYETQQELLSAREKNVEAITGEYNRINDLKEEYNSLIGVNGEVKQGYEDRANFILNELASALGMEKSDVEELIGLNGQLGDSIDAIIQKKQVEATLGAYEDSYRQAKANEIETLNNVVNATNAYDEAKSKSAALEAEYAAALEEAQKIEMAGGEVTRDITDRLLYYAQASGEAAKKENELSSALNEANSAFDNNLTTVQNYEGLKTAALNNDATEMNRWLDNLTHNYKDATSMTEEELAKQIQAQEEYIEQMVKAQESGNQRITDKAINGARERLSKLQAEYQKGTQAAQTEAQNTGNAYAQKIGEAVGAAQKSGQTIREAVEQNIKSKEAGSIGSEVSNNYAQGIESAAGTARAASETAVMNAEYGLQSGDSYSLGSNFGQGYVQGIQSQVDAARAAGVALAEAANSGTKNAQKSSSPSKVARKLGNYYGLGYSLGISDSDSDVKMSAEGLVVTATTALNEAQDSHSPSKLTYKSGVSFTQGYIKGIASLEKGIVTTVKGLVAIAVNTLKNTKFDFSGAAENATNAISGIVSNNLKYLTDWSNYNNNLKLADFDNQIKSLEASRDKEIKKAESKRDKQIAKLEKEREKKLKNLDSKDDSKQIAKIKASYDKKIKAEKNAYTKTNATITSNYKALIETQRKYKDAYQTASRTMIADLQTALSEYERAANKLITDTINGITDKYNERYDSLMNKQNSLISKLKEAGDLFNVSGAGIMTVNDLNKQTQDIIAYTDKLSKIKAKVSSELFDEIASFDMKEGSAFLDRLLSMSASDLNAYNAAYTKKMQIIQQRSEGIYKTDFDKVASDYRKDIDSAFKNLPVQLEQLGHDAMQGFVDGLTHDTDYMNEQIKTFVAGMIDQFKILLDIHSPSKVMEGLGEFSGEGFGDGMLNVKDYIIQVARQIAEAAKMPLEGFTTDLSGIKSTVNGALSVPGTVNAGNVVNNYNLVQNNTSPKSLSALETYQARRQQIAMVKAFAP